MIRDRNAEACLHFDEVDGDADQLLRDIDIQDLILDLGAAVPEHLGVIIHRLQSSPHQTG